MATPIRPEEVVNSKVEAVPDFIIDIFNNKIAHEMNDGVAIVFQEDIIKDILERLNEFTAAKNLYGRSYIFDNKLLDIEDLYKRFGWNVVYDKPAYNETYRAFWKFTPA